MNWGIKLEVQKWEGARNTWDVGVRGSYTSQESTSVRTLRGKHIFKKYKKFKTPSTKEF